MRRSLIVLLLLALPLAAADDVLTNADVVKLIKAGLSAETIEAKIVTSSARFDVSTDALVALAREGVPDQVIRAMITASPAVAAPAPRQVTTKRTTSRRYDVAVHRDTNAKCDGAELRVDGRGLKSSGCRGVDFNVAWSAVTKVCYTYGFRGTIVFSTKSQEHRISTTTPAEAKRIVEHVRGNAPAIVVTECPDGAR